MGPRSNIVVANVPGNIPPSAELDAEPLSGDAGLTVDFDAGASSDADGQITAYEWDFEGDGVIDFSSGSDPTAQHTYPDPGEYEATLCVTDNDGALAYAVAEISIANQPPQAVLNADPAVSTRLVAVHFDASLSSDSDGQIVDYAWDFEGDAVYDEHTATPVIDHLYSGIGECEATVCVTDNSGGKATAISSVTIENIPPVLEFQVTPDDPETGHHITVDLSGSYDPDGEITRYKWDFGDEVKYQSTPVATKVYSQAGEYAFALEIKDDNGALITDESEVYVSGLSVSEIENAKWMYYPYLGVVNGRPAISVYCDSYSHNALQYAGSVDEIGSDWHDLIDVSLGEYMDRKDSTCAEVNGRPAILEGMTYYRALGVSGTEWGDPMQLASGVEDRLSSILVVDGRPLTMFLKNTRELAVIKANDTDGQSWSTPYVLDLPDEVSDFSRLVPMEEEYAFVYTTCHDENLYFASVDFEAGATITQNTLIDDTNDIRIEHASFAIIDNFPAVCYIRDGKLVYNLSYRENQWYKYSYIYGIVLDASVSQNAGLVEIAGCPAIVYQRSSQNDPLIYWHANTPWGSQWNNPIILEQGVGDLEISPLQVVDGRAALVVYGHNEDYQYTLRMITVYE